MLKDFNELLELAKKNGPKKLSVAMAADKDVLLAVKNAENLGLVHPILIGDKKDIEEIAKSIDYNLNNSEIINEADNVEGSKKAVELVSSGKADILMKGFVDTPIIMRQVLNKEYGLRTENIISHLVAIDVDTYHKIFLVTDAAMNISPDVESKIKIMKNAVEVSKKLGVEKPKVGVVAANEKVSDKMIATVEAKEIKDRFENQDEFLVEGPFALDNAISKEAAKHKKIDSDVAGDVDIILVPDIEAGNILYKSLTFLAGANSAGMIVGAKAPIVLTSRADSDKAKLNSIALAVLLA